MENETEKLLKLAQSQAKTIQNLSDQITILTEQIEWFKRQMFGQKTERFIATDSKQLLLEFGDAIEEVAVVEVEALEVQPHIRKTTKAKAESAPVSWPDNLPVEELIIDVPLADRIDPITGQELKIVGEEVSCKLGIRSGFFVRKTIRIKRANPKAPEDGVLCSAMPDSIVTASKFDVSFMAWVCIQKIIFHLPIYRIVEMLATFNIKVSKQTLCNLFKTLGTRVQPIIDLMIEKVLESGVIFSDDTPVNLLQKKKCQEARIWTYVGGHPESPPYHIYQFTKTREHHHVIDFLENFKGIIHADAYQAYSKLDSDRSDISWCACWAHARRYFENATAGDQVFREKVLCLMGDLFEFEREAWRRNEAQRLEIRKTNEEPLVDELFEMLKKKQECRKLLPQSKLAKAINYMLVREDNFRNYLTHANARMENNTAERALRKTVIGRKNWLFIGSEEAGQAAMNLFSLLQTCRALDINAQEYLEDLFSRLLSHPSNRLEELLPDQWSKKKSEQTLPSTAAPMPPT